MNGLVKIMLSALMLLSLASCLATPRFFPKRYELEEEPEIVVKQKKTEEKNSTEKKVETKEIKTETPKVSEPTQEKKASSSEGI